MESPRDMLTASEGTSLTDSKKKKKHFKHMHWKSVAIKQDYF